MTLEIELLIYAETFLLLQQVCIEKTLFNKAFLIYVQIAMDKKRMNWYLGLNFIDVKDEMVQNIFLIGSVTLAGYEESE